MKTAALQQCIQFLLILLFAYAAISKLADHSAFRYQLADFPVLDNYPRLFAWLIPLAELCIVALLFIPSTHLYGFIAASITLTAFTIFLLAMVIFNHHLPCSCGGIISALSWKQHIVFNSFFLTLAVLGLIRTAKQQHKENISTLPLGHRE